MQKLRVHIAAAFAGLLVVASTWAATLAPIQLLNPTGSAAGQAIVSTGPGTAPGWAAITASNLAPVAANSVIANTTGSTAAPTAFGVPSCSAAGNALNWTSGSGLTCATGYAALASPTFTGTPAAPTAAAGTSTTQIATTAFLTQPGPIGSVTANTGRFTTLQATGTLTPSTTAGIVGTTLADSAQAGSIGEFITSTATNVSLSTGVPANITSISLSAGDWEVRGNIYYNPAGSTTSSAPGAAISATSATFPAVPLYAYHAISIGAGNPYSLIPPATRINVSSTTTVYLVGQISFAVSTMTASGIISARRVR